MKLFSAPDPEYQYSSTYRTNCWDSILSIFCRDLKAENVLLGADGAWKLCDFGSVSTNHQIFYRPEEMGIEEDNIRKHTTPAYRAPEVGLFFYSFSKRQNWQKGLQVSGYFLFGIFCLWCISLSLSGVLRFSEILIKV